MKTTARKLRVEVVETLEAFRRLEADWAETYVADPYAQYFMSWPWLRNVLADNPGRWRVLAVNCDGRRVCFLPLMVSNEWRRSRSRFRTYLQPAGRMSWGQYSGVLCEPRFEEEAIPALVEKLLRVPWRRLTMKYLAMSDRRYELFMSAFPDDEFRKEERETLINRGTIDNLICPYVELPGDYDTYLTSRVSSNTRQKIRRFDRRIEQAADLSMFDEPTASIHEDIEHLLALWSDKWADRKGPRRLDRSLRHYRRLLDQSERCQSLYLPTLWRDDRLLGAHAYVFDEVHKSVYFIVAGRDEAAREPFIGTALHAHAIRWAIDRGFEMFDFCHGNEPYKYSFGCRDKRVRNVAITSRSGRRPAVEIDSVSLGQILAQTRDFVEAGDLSNAAAACAQLHELTSISSR